MELLIKTGKGKENFADNHFHNKLRLFDILHNFPFTKSETITYKHSIYEVLKELPNDLRLRKLGNIRKVSKPHRMIAQRPAPSPPAKMKALLILEENS